MDPEHSVGRLFVAVELSDDVRHVLAAHLQGSLGDKPLPGRPIPPENWHITLRFLGATTGLQFDKLLHGLGSATLPQAFTMGLGHLGAFPRAARATVLWVGIDRGAEPLGALAAAAEEAAQAAGFASEDRPFHAHITLSRLRPHQDVRPLTEAIAPVAASQVVDEVVVYRSHLGGGPARYEVVERLPLPDRGEVSGA